MYHYLMMLFILILFIIKQDKYFLLLFNYYLFKKVKIILELFLNKKYMGLYIFLDKYYNINLLK